jgi:hypothetical protein
MVVSHLILNSILDIKIVMILQEFYADFVAIDPYHFTLNVPSNHLYILPAVVDPPSLQNFCDRVVDGIAAVFLAFKRRPIIRYQRTSDIAKRIAQETAVSKVNCKKLSDKLDMNFAHYVFKT